MKLYFVRHAESVSNAKLKDELGKGDQLSPKGIEQAERLVSVLREYQFDHIFVSPSQRTIQTITPYLRSVKRRAVILPQSTEIKDVSIKGILSIVMGRQEPGATSKPIKIPPEYDDVVAFDPEFPKSVAKGESHPEGVSRAQHLARFLRKRYEKTEQSVLLVSHGVIGRFLISHLAKLPIVPHPENAKLWVLNGTQNKFHIEIMGGTTL